MQSATITYRALGEVNFESAAQASGECGASLSRMAAPVPRRPDSDDPAVLCLMVRSLTIHAYRTLRRRSPAAANVTPDEIGELMERVIELQELLNRFRHEHQLALEDLQRWLDNLSRCVEGSLAQPPREVEK